MKICTNCKQEKFESEFYKDKNTKDKLQSWCKDCRTPYNIEYQRTMGGSGVYRIVNLITGKIYVGESRALGKRRLNHLSELRRNQHSNPELQEDFNTFGEEAFSFEVLEKINDPEFLLEQEKYYINLYPEVYNNNLRV